MTRRKHARLACAKFLEYMGYLVGGPDRGRPPTPEEEASDRKTMELLHGWGEELRKGSEGVTSVFDISYDKAGK